MHLVVVAVTDGGLKQHTDGVRKSLDTGVAESGKFVVVMILAGVAESGLHTFVEGVGLGTGSESACGGSNKL